MTANHPRVVGRPTIAPAALSDVNQGGSQTRRYFFRTGGRFDELGTWIPASAGMTRAALPMFDSSSGDQRRGRSPNSRVNVSRAPDPLAVRNTSTSTFCPTLNSCFSRRVRSEMVAMS